MNPKVELFWQQKQEVLLDSLSKLEDKLDTLSYELGNNENLSDSDREKLDQIITKVYAAYENLKDEII